MPVAIGSWIRVSIAVFCLAQAALVGLASWVGSQLLLALGEVAVLSLAAALLLSGRYTALRIQYARERTRHLRQAARCQIADDVHDLVGHELSLIAMQAGLLRLQTEGTQAEIAGELRSRAERAVRTLHDSLDLIESTPTDRPAVTDPARLVQQSRDAGVDITVHGAIGAVSAPTSLIATSIVREALTNAVRHAPGCSVELCFERAGEDVRITVVTHHARVPLRPAPEGRGLAAMRRRLDAVGGVLETGYDPRGHVLTARVPCRMSRTAPPPAPPGKRPLRRVAREVALPLAVVVAVVVTFYSWAGTGATIEPKAQSRLRIGISAATADELLPDRQAPIRLAHPPAHPHRWDCRDYTNGNFPLAVATLEVCFDNDAIVRITNLAARPLW
jgi:two-component sensor histidine kinase